MGSNTSINIPPLKHIVFFDGVCNLCNNAVNTIIDRDKKEEFVFEPLQSENASALLGEPTVEKLEYMIVYTEKSEVLRGSEAALFIADRVSGWPSLFRIARILPKSIRDFLYQSLAKYRYKVFGKRNSCRLPESHIRNRFLESYQNG